MYIILHGYTLKNLAQCNSNNYYDVLNKINYTAGSVWTLSYDPERRVLFSGGFDQTIVVWDIGSRKGVSYELVGHTLVESMHVCVPTTVFSDHVDG